MLHGNLMTIFVNVK